MGPGEPAPLSDPVPRLAQKEARGADPLAPKGTPKEQPTAAGPVRPLTRCQVATPQARLPTRPALRSQLSRGLPQQN